jgi:hypothetical protein
MKKNERGSKQLLDETEMYFQLPICFGVKELEDADVDSSGLAAATLVIWLPVSSNIVLHSFIEKLDLEIAGVAIGTLH